MQDDVFKQVIAGARDVIHQAHTLLMPLHAHDYNRVVSPYFQSSVGQHMRHIIDAFQTVKVAIDDVDAAAVGCVNYERRARGTEIERCLVSAKTALIALDSWLETLTPEQLCQTCNVTQCLSAQVVEGHSVPSVFARELVFLISHTVHHFALMRSMLVAMDYPVAAHIGKANGTLAFEQMLN